MVHQRLKIPYPVIVEGRYDKLRLEQVMEGQIIPIDGFGVFNQKEKKQLLCALSKKTPLIVLTDSDGAGKVIRSYLTSSIPRDRLIHLYVPRIEGKEKRKEKPSAEGILGVEGIGTELLFQLLSPYADEQSVARRMQENPLSKTDLYVDGLTGRQGCAERRDALAERVGLPRGMTPNALLSALRMLCSYGEYCELVGRESDSSASE